MFLFKRNVTTSLVDVAHEKERAGDEGGRG